jgi:hypothetical protein
MLLRQAHGSRPDPFALCVRAIGREKAAFDMGERRLRAARAELHVLNFLRIVQRGGRGLRDPSPYALVRETPLGR